MRSVVALACYLIQRHTILTLNQIDVPIPGSRTVDRLRENMQSVEIAAKLSPDDIREIRDWVEKAEPQGERYPAAFRRPHECGKLEDWKGE